MGQKLNEKEKERTLEIKQNFLSSAISDISTYIQLTDTKVSIIMGAAVAILVGIGACYEPISNAIEKIIPCSWIGVLFIILTVSGALSVILIFVFGILTVRGHVCVISYKSKWFLSKSAKEYSFDEFTKDIQEMTAEDVIINMAAELYKLNDINRQKMKTMKWTLYTFSALLVVILAIAVLFLANAM